MVVPFFENQNGSWLCLALLCIDSAVVSCVIEHTTLPGNI